MKVKPYRACDICSEEYRKSYKCMRVKMNWNVMGYDGANRLEKLDICPKCGELMFEWILKNRIKELKKRSKDG